MTTPNPAPATSSVTVLGTPDVSQLPRLPAELSDLFFNHEHPHYDLLYGSTDPDWEFPTMDQVRAAIGTDARDFADNYRQTVALFGLVDPAQLAADFLDRR